MTNAHLIIETCYLSKEFFWPYVYDEEGRQDESRFRWVPLDNNAEYFRQNSMEQMDLQKTTHLSKHVIEDCRSFFVKNNFYAVPVQK